MYCHINLIKYKINLGHYIYLLLTKSIITKDTFAVVFSLLSFQGVLVVSKVEPTDVGGSLNVSFMCGGCEKRS